MGPFEIINARLAVSHVDLEDYSRQIEITSNNSLDLKASYLQKEGIYQLEKNLVFRDGPIIYQYALSKPFDSVDYSNEAQREFVKGQLGIFEKVSELVKSNGGITLVNPIPVRLSSINNIFEDGVVFYSSDETHMYALENIISNGYKFLNSSR